MFYEKGGVFGGGQEGRYEYQKLVVLIKGSFFTSCEGVFGVEAGAGRGAMSPRSTHDECFLEWANAGGSAPAVVCALGGVGSRRCSGESF